jgi:cytochrome c oxidase subunit 2
MLDENYTDHCPRRIGRRSSAELRVLSFFLWPFFSQQGCARRVRKNNSVPSPVDPHSTPAESIRHLAHFVLGVTRLIFLVVFSLYLECRREVPQQRVGAESEPGQVYGSTQIELAWTIVPILIVLSSFGDGASDSSDRGRS